MVYYLEFKLGKRQTLIQQIPFSKNQLGEAEYLALGVGLGLFESFDFSLSRAVNQLDDIENEGNPDLIVELF